jgi:hypothetical protein
VLSRHYVGGEAARSAGRYPNQQFHGGHVMPELVAAYWTVAEATASDFTAGSRCVSPDPELLDGLSPVQWAAERDPGRLAVVAAQDASGLSR